MDVFGTHFLTFPPLEFVKQCLRWEKCPLHRNFLFFRRDPNPNSVKLRSQTLQLLDRREIWTPSLEPIFTHSHRWDLLNNVFAEKLVSHIDSKMEATIFSPSLWHLETLTKQTEEKIERNLRELLEKLLSLSDYTRESI